MRSTKALLLKTSVILLKLLKIKPVNKPALVHLNFYFFTLKNEIPPQMVTFDPAVGQTGLLRQPHAADLHFLFLHFDLWPLTTVPGIMKQPVLGIVWTIVVVVIGSGVYYLGTGVFGMSPDTFLVTVPVPFLFGSTVLLAMLGGSATVALTGVARGLTSAVLAMIIGSVLASGYLLAMPLLTRDVPADALNQHLWLASALLGVTFPFLAMYHDYFGLWPLAPKPHSPEPAIASDPARSVS